MSLGFHVGVIMQRDQSTGKITGGTIKQILTSAPYHSSGISVLLEGGQIGRVCEIYSGPGPAQFSTGMA